MEKNIVRYLGYLSLLIGLSMLGVVWVYFIALVSSSIGIVITNSVAYGYVEELGRTVNLSLIEAYNRIFIAMIMLGALGAILSYIGIDVTPRLLREYKF
jgi:hypothetical protein